MKKLYVEPDFDIVNVRLLNDVLIASEEDNVDTDGDELPGGGGGFPEIGDEGGFID